MKAKPKPYDIREATGGTMWQERMRNKWTKEDELKAYQKKLEAERKLAQEKCNCVIS